MCVICTSNRFHSFVFKLCIMIVHTLKICTNDAGLEQSLVLFFNFFLFCFFFCVCFLLQRLNINHAQMQNLLLEGANADNFCFIR